MLFKWNCVVQDHSFKTPIPTIISCDFTRQQMTEPVRSDSCYKDSDRKETRPSFLNFLICDKWIVLLELYFGSVQKDDAQN